MGSALLSITRGLATASRTHKYFSHQVAEVLELINKVFFFRLLNFNRVKYYWSTNYPLALMVCKLGSALGRRTGQEEGKSRPPDQMSLNSSEGPVFCLNQAPGYPAPN